MGVIINELDVAVEPESAPQEPVAPSAPAPQVSPMDLGRVLRHELGRQERVRAD